MIFEMGNFSRMFTAAEPKIASHLFAVLDHPSRLIGLLHPSFMIFFKYTSSDNIKIFLFT